MIVAAMNKFQYYHGIYERQWKSEDLKVKLATEGKYSSLELRALDYVAMYTCRLLPEFRRNVIIISPFLPRGWCQTLIHKLHYMTDFKRSY